VRSRAWGVFRNIGAREGRRLLRPLVAIGSVRMDPEPILSMSFVFANAAIRKDDLSRRLVVDGTCQKHRMDADPSTFAQGRREHSSCMPLALPGRNDVVSVVLTPAGLRAGGRPGAEGSFHRPDRDWAVPGRPSVAPVFSSTAVRVGAMGRGVFRAPSIP
jgi:hypothetical protein